MLRKILLAVVFCVVLVGCGSGFASDNESSNATGNFVLLEEITLGTDDLSIDKIVRDNGFEPHHYFMYKLGKDTSGTLVYTDGTPISSYKCTTIEFWISDNVVTNINIIYKASMKNYKGISEYLSEMYGESVIEKNGQSKDMAYVWTADDATIRLEAQATYTMADVESGKGDFILIISSNNETETINAIVEEIIGYKNDALTKKMSMIVEYESEMSEEQLQECMISYGRWRSLEYAEEEIKEILKNPRTYKRYGGNVYIPRHIKDTQYSVKIVIEYGAENSFGAEVINEAEVHIYFDLDFESLSYDYNYGWIAD